ncbi:MAG: tRNA 2-selenouridine(34) synthase MnmH [Chitinophagaceae bacterium]
MSSSVTVERFLELSKEFPVLDVRSPGEYNHAHIPGAISFPLFTDEERKVVGTAYKRESRKKAIAIGLDFFGPKMRKMVEAAEKLVPQQNAPTILVHCWRGGMRSGAVAWLLQIYGFKVFTLAGGYKQYRQWVLQQFAKTYPFVILGGYTGSGKTEILQALQQIGGVMLNLEAIASHKGSAFGNLGMPPQPGAEQFENNLAHTLQKVQLLAEENQHKVIWVESESRRIGNINLPADIFNQLLQAPLYFLDIPFETRLNYLVNTYGQFPVDQLQNAIERISRKLGGLDAKMAIDFLQKGEIKDCFTILLKYYDKFYQKGYLATSPISFTIQANEIEPIKLAKQLLDNYQPITWKTTTD